MLPQSALYTELIKTTVQEKDSLNDVVSSTLDTKLIRLVNQLAFIEVGDHQATSAVILGGFIFPNHTSPE
ncbi:hypothetical protein [Spirosoma endophyticum]|uniref:hypothetical protein n=1 Tax=Spirosoma endophyticum TaxID=662367 RepID=UPI000B83BB50|nr:hypothetical protein [Spirosoma endophyticum]